MTKRFYFNLNILKINRSAPLPASQGQLFLANHRGGGERLRCRKVFIFIINIDVAFIYIYIYIKLKFLPFLLCYYFIFP